jgi:hypothetical protein
VRFGERNTIPNPEWARDRPEWAAYERYLTDWLGGTRIVLLHTRDRRVADSEGFVAPLRSAPGCS